MLREALTASSLGKEVRYGKALHLKLFKLVSPTDSAEEAFIFSFFQIVQISSSSTAVFREFKISQNALEDLSLIHI